MHNRLGLGLAASYLSLLVLLPLAAVAWKAAEGDSSSTWQAISNPQAVAALKFTLLASGLVSVISAIAGTAIAWVLVRDKFFGRRAVDTLIDLPFALPTIVVGITLLALYGPTGGTGINIAFTRASVVAALLFVTLPFVVRSVQPVLLELDRDMEEAAASLGANTFQTLWRVILPPLVPAIATGTALSFAKAIGEFGSVVLISGNVPFQTEVASVYIFGQIESDNPAGAAAVSTLLLAIALVVLGVIRFLQRKMVHV